MRHSIIMTIFLALLFSGITFSYIIESGDGGASFASNLSAEKCGEPDVSSVYVCSGNVVKVISFSEEGYAFYKPDGRVVRCGLVPPTIMGAECFQYIRPDPCFSGPVCERSVNATVPQGDNISSNISSPGLSQFGTENPLMNGKDQAKPPTGGSAANAAPAPKTESRLSLDLISSLSDNTKLLLSIIMAGVVVFALTTFIFIRSL